MWQTQITISPSCTKLEKDHKSEITKQLYPKQLIKTYIFSFSYYVQFSKFQRSGNLTNHMKNIHSTLFAPESQNGGCNPLIVEEICFWWTWHGRGSVAIRGPKKEWES